MFDGLVAVADGGAEQGRVALAEVGPGDKEVTLALLAARQRAGADEHLDVAGAVGPEGLGQVAEEFHVPALVGGDADGVGVLLHRRLGHLRHAAVMAQVDDLGPMGHEQAPDHVDGGVVAVEQGGGGDDPGRSGTSTHECSRG